MGSGTIQDSNIIAYSEQSASTPARNGRLNYTSESSWCAGTSDKNPYLQIDLQTLHIICAVSTQGNSQFSSRSVVEEFHTAIIYRWDNLDRLQGRWTNQGI